MSPWMGLKFLFFLVAFFKVWKVRVEKDPERIRIRWVKNKLKWEVLLSEADPLNELWKRTRLVRVLCMEVSNVVVCSQFVSQDPTKFFVGPFVSEPLHIVQQRTLAPASVNLWVQNFCNLIFNFTVDLDRRRWIRCAIRNRAWMEWFELRNMENWMNSAKVVWKL